MLIYIYSHTHTHSHTHKHTHTHTHTHAYTCIHTCIHTHTYTYKYTYIIYLYFCMQDKRSEHVAKLRRIIQKYLKGSASLKKKK